MRAYLGIKYYSDNRNQAVIEAISDVLAGCGMTTYCVARDLEKWGEVQLEVGELMHRTFAVVERCDLVVIELSEKGVGLGIEAGYAYAKGIPVMTVARRGSDVSETLRGVSSDVIFYDNPSDLTPFFAGLS